MPPLVVLPTPSPAPMPPPMVLPSETLIPVTTAPIIPPTLPTPAVNPARVQTPIPTPTVPTPTPTPTSTPTPTTVPKVNPVPTPTITTPTIPTPTPTTPTPTITTPSAPKVNPAPIVVPMTANITSSMNYINPITSELVQTKWFSSDVANKALYVIISANRFLLYGGCGVYYSTFTFGASEADKLPIQGISVKNTSPDCQTQGNPLSAALSSTSYLKAGSDGSFKSLSFFSAADKLLLTMSTKVPE